MITGSELVEEHLKGSVLWTYVGFRPRLIPEVVRWYDQSEDVKRKILQAYEKDKRTRYEYEHYRRQAIRQPISSGVSWHVSTSAYESPYRSVVDTEDCIHAEGRVNISRGPSEVRYGLTYSNGRGGTNPHNE
ncbi:hypothetical protein PM082_006798 [Marasmius tenuissimus]|nr:hypothetical protein PM082_006798 [Marasmius tenuissimus]